MSSTGTPGFVQRNQEFYLDDLIFLVNGLYFKVYAFYFLRHSPKIRSIVNTTTQEGGIHFGNDIKHPITLDKVERSDFEHFLGMVYPKQFLSQPCNRTFQEWIGVLKVAAELQIDDLRRRCISAIDSMRNVMTPIDKLRVARQLVYANWFIDGMCGIITRDRVLNASEAEILGFETTFRIMQIRELWRISVESNRSSRSAPSSQAFAFTGSPHTHINGKEERLRGTVQWAFRSQLAELDLTVDENTKPKSSDILDGYPTDDVAVLFTENKSASGTAEMPSKSSTQTFRYSQYNPKSIIFQVGEELFRVHQDYFHKHSPVFRDMLQLNEHSAEGSRDEDPLRLAGVKPKDFILFLSLITSNPELNPVSLSYEGWQSILDLSILWRMRHLRKHCIEKMAPLPTTISPLEKALMARKYMIEVWLVDAFLQLIQREEVLTDEEVDQLDSATAIKLFQIQAKSLKAQVTRLAASKVRKTHHSFTSSPSSEAEYDLEKSIRNAFQSELQRLNNYDADSELNPIPASTWDFRAFWSPPRLSSS